MEHWCYGVDLAGCIFILCEKYAWQTTVYAVGRGSVCWACHKMAGHKGAGNIPTVEWDKGVISNVICFDDSFIGFVHGMGANTTEKFKDTDILFVPSWDWDSVKNAHTRMAAFRAAENGESVVKPTYDGISAATDPYGRTLETFSTAENGFDTVWFAEVHQNGIKTIYSVIGTGTDAVFLILGPLLAVMGIIIYRRKQMIAGTNTNNTD